MGLVPQEDNPPGEQPPIHQRNDTGDNRERQPDRRKGSVRWALASLLSLAGSLSTPSGRSSANPDAEPLARIAVSTAAPEAPPAGPVAALACSGGCARLHRLQKSSIPFFCCAPHEPLLDLYKQMSAPRPPGEAGDVYAPCPYRPSLNLRRFGLLLVMVRTDTAVGNPAGPSKLHAATA